MCFFISYQWCGNSPWIWFTFLGCVFSCSECNIPNNLILTPSVNCKLSVKHTPRNMYTVQSNRFFPQTFRLHLREKVTHNAATNYLIHLLGISIRNHRRHCDIHCGSLSKNIPLFSVMLNCSCYGIDLCVWYVLSTYLVSSTWRYCCSYLLYYTRVMQLLISYTQHDPVICNTGPLSDYVCVAYTLFRNMFGPNKVCIRSSSYGNIIAKSHFSHTQISVCKGHFFSSSWYVVVKTKHIYLETHISLTNDSIS